MRWGRPEVTVLWNGIPLEEYGVADALVEVSFTKTVGRTGASKKFKAGKPKVGGATIKFELSDDVIARVLLSMISTVERPRISIAFGWEGDEMYWTGGVNAGITSSPKLRKLFQPVSFKADAPRIEYGSAIPSLTISGVSDMDLTLAEKFKPRVFSNVTVGEALRTITDEHGITLDVEGMINMDARLGAIVSPTDESDLGLIRRIAVASGNALITSYIESASDTKEFQLRGGAPGEEGVTARVEVPGTVDAYQYTVSGAEKSRDWAARARTVLKISRLPAYHDLSSVEQLSVPVLGWNLREEVPGLIDLSSLSVSMQGYKSSPTVVSGSSTKKGEDEGVGAMPVEPRVPVGQTVQPPFQYIDLLTNPLQKPEDKKAAAKAAQASRYEVIATALPEEIDAGALTGDYLRMVMEQSHFSLELSATVNPGVPWLQAPMLVRVQGTHGHDGLYGVETSTTSWGPGGMQTQLTLKPASSMTEGSAAPIVPKDDESPLPGIPVRARVKQGEDSPLFDILGGLPEVGKRYNHKYLDTRTESPVVEVDEGASAVEDVSPILESGL